MSAIAGLDIAASRAGACEPADGVVIEHEHWEQDEAPWAKVLREHLRKMRRMWDVLITAMNRKDHLVGEIKSKHTDEQRRHDLERCLEDVEGRITELDSALRAQETKLCELDQRELEERPHRKSRGRGPAKKALVDRSLSVVEEASP